MSEKKELWSSRLVVSATALFFLGAVTGVLIPTAGDDSVKFSRLLAAHLNALLGCFWMLGLAWTMPRLACSPGQLRALCSLTVLACWSNWAVTLAKAQIGVAGLDFGEGGANGAIWLALVLTVVLPTIGGSALWFWTAWKGRSTPST